MRRGPASAGKLKAARRAAQAERAFRAACEHHRRGDLGRAEAAYRAVLDLEPAHAASLLNWGLIARGTGRLDLALTLLERGVGAAPGDPDVLGTLGALLAEAERWPEATPYLEQAAARAPGDPVVRYNLAKTYQSTQQPARAAELFRDLAAQAPGDPEVWTGYGAALLDAGRSEEGIAALERAVALDARYAHAHNELGGALLDQGRFDEAAEAFRRALACDPDLTEALWNLARTRRYSSADADEIESMEAALARRDLSPRKASEAHFALGKVYEDCGDYPRAGEHYERANALRAGEGRFDAAARASEAEHIAAVCTRARLEALQPLGDPSELPVFIVGMPRSGTSLVEQVIASHSRASGAGELADFPRLVETLGERTGVPYPACLAALTGPLVSEAAEGYLAALRAHGDPGSLRITDKLPGNFNFLGLIAVVFPRARVIHCRRDPMDVCLSLYTRPFTHGHEYSYRPADIAAEYRAYERLMTHWREACPLPIHELHYEDVIRDPEAAIRGIVAHCGLEWEPRCLEFHRTERRVRTASQWQVRQPVYSTSVERWRRFGPLAREFERLLGPEGGS